MIKGIHHAAISTTDLQRAIAFYRDLLGFKVIHEFSWPKGSENADTILGLEDTSAKAAMLATGNAMIELFQFESPVPKSSDPERPVCDHGITHICLYIEDIDAEYNRLKNAGMSFHCPPQKDGGMNVTYGRDPDGNVIELMEVLNTKSPFAMDL